MNLYGIITVLRKLLDGLSVDGLAYSTLELCIYQLETLADRDAAATDDRTSLHEKIEYLTEWKTQATSDMKYYVEEIRKLKTYNNPKTQGLLIDALNQQAGRKNIGISEEPFASIVGYLMTDSLIMAIKELRTITGWGLRDSKDFIEEVCYAAGTRVRPTNND